MGSSLRLCVFAGNNTNNHDALSYIYTARYYRFHWLQTALDNCRGGGFTASISNFRKRR